MGDTVIGWTAAGEPKRSSNNREFRHRIRHETNTEAYDDAMSIDEITKVSVDGLRYKDKESGSPFSGRGGSQISTMSCFLCGIHKPRAMGSFKRFLNKPTFVCGDCKPIEK